MKKRTMALIATACTASVLMVGCQAGGLSNEYVTVGDYKGIEVAFEGEKVQVTDTDVDAKIEYILSGYAEKIEVTGRAAQNGDIANIDYVGTKDGVAFDGGSAQKFDLTLGSGTFIDGFESGIVGHNVGETFDLNLKFPDAYHSAELAGKEVVFTVTLNSLSVEEVPELTDEFVKENLSDTATTIEEYKVEVKTKLQVTNDENYETELRNAAWTVVLDDTKVKKYPEEAVSEYMDMVISEYQTMATYYAMDYAEFLETYMGMDEEAFKAEVESVAQMQVKSDLVRNLIAENENIDDSEEIYQEIYEKYGEGYGYPDVETFLAEMEKAESLDALNDMVHLEIVQNWVVDHCKIVPVEK